MIFIYIGKADPAWVGHLKRIWAEAETGKFQIVTSALTIAEVLRLREQPRLTSVEEQAIRGFFEAPHLILVDLDRLVAERAREIVWRFNVTPKDAVHVASALQAGCDVMHTNDDKLLKRSGTLGGDPPLTCEVPQWLGQMDLSEVSVEQKA